MTLVRLGFGLGLWLGAGLLGCSAKPVADVVFTGGRVYTLDEENPVATAVAARDGVILYVGDADGVEAYRGSHTREVDLQGGTAFPGFTDAHMHMGLVGARTLNLDLSGIESLAALLGKVQERVRETPAGEWIVGRGWIETFWSPPRFPTRFDLDTVSPHHPVYLERVDGHGAVVNSKALERAGISVSTPDPVGGQIVRENGRPTGTLIDTAMELVWAHLPRETEEVLARCLALGAAEHVRKGWTAVQVAGNYWRQRELLEQMCADGAIPIRVYDSILGPTKDSDRLLTQGAEGTEPHTRFTVRTIKVHYDGTLGSGGAALLEPYADREGSGFVKYQDHELLELFTAALRQGIQIQVHCVGDRANRKMLDLFEVAFARVPPSERAVVEPRWRIEHAHILHPDDVPRFAQLGVMPSMQPSHAITDLHFAPSRLGLERLAQAYAWRSLLDAGSVIPGGSNAPVEDGDPILEFYAACVRKDPRRDPAGTWGPGWYREQRVTRKEALQMFTEWAAEAAFQETWRGTLEVGKACDISVFSRDLMTVPEDRILGTRCLLTIVAGEVIYSGEEMPAN